MKSKALRFLPLLIGMAFPTGAAWAQSSDGFLQGPERVGQARALGGVVVGRQRQASRDCYLMLADAPAVIEAGLGGGGRFFWCTRPGSHWAMGRSWHGRGVQTGTQMARVGARWRVLPVFQAASGN